MTQSVHISIEALSDHASFPDGNGRFLTERLFDQLANIGKGVNVSVNFQKQLLLKILEKQLDMGQHTQRVAKGDHIPGVGRPITHLSQKPFQIVNGI